MRRKSIWLLLLLSALAALAFRGSIETWTNDIVARHSARKTLASWGLEPSRDNVDLYLSANHANPFGRGSDAESMGSAEPVDSIAAEVRFSDRWNYGQLYEQGQVTIGVYVSDPVVPARLDRIAREYPAGPGRRISVKWLRSREELLRALAGDTLVFYFGHANTGRGIRFEHEEPIWMDDGTLDRLDVKCKVFGYFGCRTDRYFRDTWQTHFPAVDFIATTYVCHTTGLAPDILDQLVQGLQQGRDLGRIVEAMNQDKAAALLFGRMNEVRKYRNPDDHADRLFTY
jgi:hypothetical protein